MALGISNYSGGNTVDEILITDLYLGSDTTNKVTATTAEINILDGVTATTAEINLVDGSVAGTAVASKALVLGANKNIDTIVIADGGLNLGADAGTAVTATAAEINLIDGSIAGTAVASKVLVLGASKNIDEITIADLKLASGTPVNAVNATGTLTFSSTVSDGETVTIGTDIYEFDTNSSVTEGNIAVDVSGGATAPAAVTALVAAITANGSSVVTAADGAGDTVVVTAKTAGVVGNSIASTETCTNGSWGAATLASGVDGTVASDKGFLYADASYIYYATAANTVADKNWRRIALGSAY